MENENVNQQPTYEQLVQAYNQLFAENQQLRSELTSARTDKILERISILIKIMENKDNYSTPVIKLVEWHLKQMLAKPKKEEQ